VAAVERAHESILSTVARHEAELIAQLDAARQDAKGIVESARAEARRLIQDADAKLAEEAAAIRLQRQEARQRTFDETVRAAEERLAGVREEARRRAPAVTERVLELFMPRGAMGDA
jgi:vacuolar-type H+-ATPase subunit H